MRLIVRKHICRSFFELDAMSDRECDDLLMRILRNTWYQPIRYAAVAVGVMFGMWLAWIIVTYSADLVVWFYRLVWVGRPNDHLMIALGMFVVFFVPALSGLISRDVTLYVFVRRLLKHRIRDTRCPGCRYLLFGQRAVDGVVRCPECGRETTLTALNIDDPDDLIPKPQLASPPAAPPVGHG